MASSQVSLSTISANLAEFASQTSASFNKLNDSICHLSEDMKSLRVEVTSLQQSVSFAHDEIENLKKEATTENEKLQHRVITLEAKLLAAELYSKKQNLLFRGIPAEKDENLVEVVCKILQEELKVNNARNVMFVNIHRLPKIRGNPIIAKFVSMLDRNMVLQHAYKLPPKSGIGVSEHLPVVIYKQKESLRDAFRHARGKGMKPKYKLVGTTMYLCIGVSKYKTSDEYFDHT
ncbi:Hypp9602 [Branchiostoma lanceolatum]|uniref:Hypp9602 protein n=1 Tax=Branchiostoma lanceolatum TaxID=7740 RepID=A0A8S4MNP1_BRALA|nr:Hypp9602 [Branchiostoma lanceolatum]